VKGRKYFLLFELQGIAQSAFSGILILKFISDKWTGFIWFSLSSVYGFCEYDNEDFGPMKE
jgi:hypothetical protein